MEVFNAALSNVKVDLQEISSTISHIYKNIPENYIPNTLREAHRHLDYIQDYMNEKTSESILPKIQIKHHRSKTSEIKPPVPIDPCSYRMSSAAREKFQLKTTSSKFSRLHSNQNYQRPKFTRVSHARVVPKATRKDPIANPVNISMEDKDLGLFDIVNKGLVAKNANLTKFFEFLLYKLKKLNFRLFPHNLILLKQAENIYNCCRNS